MYNYKQFKQAIADDKARQQRLQATYPTTKITVKQALENNGMTIEDCCMDSIVPTVCIHGCMSEPDGYCQHGNSSVLMQLGII